MQDHVWVVSRWWETFETYESRKLKGALSWLAIPTKHEGRGWKRVTRRKDAPIVVAGWYPTLQVAAKMPVRGVLATLEGPLTPSDLSEYTFLPAKVFETCLSVLALADIGWVERKPWDVRASFAQNMETVLDGQRLSEFRSRSQRKPAEKKKGKPGGPPDEPPGTPAAPTGDPQPPAGSSGEQQPPAETSGQQGTGITGQESTKQRNIPLPSPKGRPQASENFSSGNGSFITDFAVAKKRICLEILNGRNPERPWSDKANERLQILMSGCGLPVSELERIAWFRSLPASPEIPELADRRLITETTLMEYWGDELSRAEAYWNKVKAGNARPAKKEEPPRWREFLKWYHESDQLPLPVSFYHLDNAQQMEYREHFHSFEAAVPAKAKAA